jgi:phage terminase small subunit
MTAKPRQPRYSQIFAHDAEMQETAKAKWAEVVEHLTINGWITPSRLQVADRYARAYAEYESIYPVAVKEGPVTVGPNGGDVFNFRWSVIEKLNERLAKFEAKLKIDPADNASEKPPASKPTAADEYLD